LLRERRRDFDDVEVLFAWNVEDPLNALILQGGYE